MATKLITTNGVVWVLNAINLNIQTLTATRAGIAATSTDGLILANTTPATAGVPVQMSPRLRFRGNVWNTTVTAANNTDDWWIEALPVSGTTPSSILKFGSSLNGGAATYPMTLTSAGQMIAGNGVANYPGIGFSDSSGMWFGTNSLRWSVAGTERMSLTAAGALNAVALTASATGYINFATRANIYSPADAQFKFQNGAETAGVGLDFATDAVLKVRTRAQTGYATVDALGYSVGGAAGASFGPGGVTSITVVNGIVTAIS